MKRGGNTEQRHRPARLPHAKNPRSDLRRESQPYGATVAERLARSPPTKANRVQSPAGSPDFPKWKSCQTMPLVGGLSLASPALIHFNHPHRLSRPRCSGRYGASVVCGRKLLEEGDSRSSGLELELELESCLLLNTSQCDVSEGEGSFLVTVYNPLSRPVSPYLRFPVTGNNYTITDVNGTKMSSQLVVVPQSIVDLWYRSSNATRELVFRAERLPPLGFTSYLVTPTGTPGITHISGDSHFGNQNISVELNSTTGLVSKIIYGDVDMSLSQDFHYYIGAVGDNFDASYRASGAYIFRPNSSDQLETVAKVVNTTVYKGVSRSLCQIASPTHRALMFACSSGKEVISKFTTDLDSQHVFHTDSNGREMLRRRRDQRPTWDVHLEEPVSGNYYPVTSKIAVDDEAAGLRLAVLTDRAQGGSSLHNGQIELMVGVILYPTLTYSDCSPHVGCRFTARCLQVHRRLFHDDDFGVGEALNEKAFGRGLVARGKHYLVAGNSSCTVTRERVLAQELLLAPWLFFSPVDYTSAAAASWKKQVRSPSHFARLNGAWDKNQHQMRKLMFTGF
ncbi:hypothetical protein PR048_003802 [Dryococelus australis]|uniref:Uncharacterized protein n=1 Tax=Dryococelus australis TaxID=614101 RepID=A0ABQ9IP84_9NEOP|nr:hypothetical protein PR048_003802 [Dryococelus australis]